MPLQESRRTQLDDIVMKMRSNQEPDSNIQFVVDDFKHKYESEAGSALPPFGMGDLKMIENQAEPLKQPSYNGYNAPLPDAEALIAPLKLAGNTVKALSTGPINAVAQGIQDKGVNPSGAWQAGKNVVKALVNPVTPGPDPIQSSETSLERAGVPNEPRETATNVPGFVVKVNPEAYGFTPEQAALLKDEDMIVHKGKSVGQAEELGAVADMFTPAYGLSVLGAAGKLAGMAGKSEAAAGLLRSAGGAAQKVAIKQAKSAVPLLSRHIREGAESENFLKEGLLAGGKEKAFEKSRALSKELSGKADEIIQKASSDGATIDGFAELDALVEPYLKGGIETSEGVRLTEPSSARFLKKARNLITRVSKNGDGILTLKQANVVKKWLQKQADYPAKAEAKGIPLAAGADEAGLTAADLGHRFRTKIETAAPDVAAVNKRLSTVIPLKRAAGWREMVRERQELVPLKAFVALIAGLKSLGALGLNSAWKSGRVSSTMYKLGDRLIKAGDNIKEQNRIAAAIQNAVKNGHIKEDEIDVVKAPALGVVRKTAEPDQTQARYRRSSGE